MKRSLQVLILLSLLIIQANAQQLEWAYTAALGSRSQAVALKEDHSGNYYFASFTDSVSTRISTQMEKRDVNRQLLWQKSFLGNAGISDIEINATNHAIVVGYFIGSISIDGIILTTIDKSGFIFEADEAGSVQWAHALTLSNEEFIPVDLFLAADNMMYLTSEISGSAGFCAFHKLNATGNIIKDEFNFNFDNRTYSHILADADGNVYLSGTCGNSAMFDTISVPGFSYQNFLAKFDSTFTAQWVISREYITFDHNNKLVTDGQHLYWAFDDFTGGADTVKIIKTAYNGQVANEVNAPFTNAFFPSLDYSMNQFGNSVLLVNAFTRFYLYGYDPSFNITWMDTIHISITSFPLYSNLNCYDSSFYIASSYMGDTLQIDSVQLINPNAGANYPSDIFIAKWSFSPTTNVSTVTSLENLMLFPNPAVDHINISTGSNYVNSRLMIFNMEGKMIRQISTGASTNIRIDLLDFENGMYVVKLIDKDLNTAAYGKLLIQH